MSPSDSPLLQALAGDKPDITPIWIMRQAGRYLPEYRKVRAQAGSFLNLCKTPELACEVTLQPLRRFDLDAAILFSDILTIPDALELGLEFHEGAGPRLEQPLRSAEQVAALPDIDVAERLHYVADACQLIRANLDPELPLIGFAGSPYTLACYMIEGGSSKDWARPRAFAYQHPESFQLLLDKLVAIIGDYLCMQAAAGADVLQIFDTWGGTLSAHGYQRLSLQPMAGIVRRVKSQHPSIAIIVFTKGCGNYLPALASCGADAIGVDWACSMERARAGLPELCLQGNLDPAVLAASEAAIATETDSVLEQMRGRAHIFNLGHGITPDINPDRVKFLVDYVHSWGH